MVANTLPLSFHCKGCPEYTSSPIQFSMIGEGCLVTFLPDDERAHMQLQLNLAIWMEISTLSVLSKFPFSSHVLSLSILNQNQLGIQPKIRAGFRHAHKGEATYMSFLLKIWAYIHFGLINRLIYVHVDLNSPCVLGEAYHILVNLSNIWLSYGRMEIMPYLMDDTLSFSLGIIKCDVDQTCLLE